MLSSNGAWPRAVLRTCSYHLRGLAVRRTETLQPLGGANLMLGNVP